MKKSSKTEDAAGIRVAGLDLSLTGPGIAVIASDWRGDIARVISARVPHDEHVGPSDAQRLARASAIARDIVAVLSRERVRHVFVESYGFGIANDRTRAYLLGELGGIVRLMCKQSLGVVPVSITASSARKVFLGNGRAKKNDVIAALKSMGWTRSHDEGDALLIANAGLAELGYPAITLA